jgi:hypothetical protein
LGEVIFPDFVNTFQLITFHKAVVVLIASWVFQAENSEDLVHAWDVNSGKGGF